MKFRPAAILVLGMLSCVAAGANRNPKTYDLWLNADITIDPSGRMTALEWTDTQPGRQLVAGRITPRVQAWEFVPATVNGQPMQTRTGLKVRMKVIENVDGSVALEVADARTGPRVNGALRPPAYPQEAAVAGVDATVLVEIEVGPDGKPVILDMKFDGSSGTTGRRSHRTAFLAAAQAAVQDWTFQPEVVAGQAVRTRMQVPMDFCVSQRCAWQESLKHRSGLPSNMPIALDSAVSFKSDIRASMIP